MRGQDVPQAVCTAIVPLNVRPWTRFYANFQLNAKAWSTEGFVVTSSDTVVPCSVGPDVATRCDNRPECSRMDDECWSQCDPLPFFCDDECAKKSCRFSRGSRVCDGYINKVMDGSKNCSREAEENCAMRFSCKSKGMVSIDTRYYCDGIFHCDDNSDETTTDCLNKRFNCTIAGGAISISKEFVMELKTATKVKMKVVNCVVRKDFTAKSENQYQSIENLFKMV